MPTAEQGTGEGTAKAAFFFEEEADTRPNCQFRVSLGLYDAVLQFVCSI